MTPKNREELQQRIKDWCETPGLFLDDLEAAGLAIVPVEPTDKMCEVGDYGYYGMGSDEVWENMLAASPFVKEV